MQISFKLGLRAQEIAQINSRGEFRLLQVMTLPAAYTKGADAMNRSKTKYERKTISFKQEAIDHLIRQVEKFAQAAHPLPLKISIRQLSNTKENLETYLWSTLT